MAQEADLYSILVTYANKNKSPNIVINSFLEFLEKYARKYSKESPIWDKWLEEKEIKFWAELSILSEEGKCELFTKEQNSYIYMPNYYPVLLNSVYRNADDDAENPFPCEESLGITLPENQTMHLNSSHDLFSIMDTPKHPAYTILKINFPDNFGSALVLPSMFPRHIAEIALLKIRIYLKRYGNKEYTYHKLSTALQGKESFLKDQLDQIIIRPLDTFNTIKDARELSYVFWAHFCSLAKNDIKRKGEHLSTDIAAYQSFFIIETINGYYKAKAQKQREKETAFKNLEGIMAKPPYLYSMKQMLGFTNSLGKLLLGFYSTEEFETWLKNQTTIHTDRDLPPLLLMKGQDPNEQYFLLKEKMPAFCAMLLTEVRIRISDALTKHWSALLKEQKKEPAMDNDEEFEKALLRTAKKLSPELVTLLADPRLALVYMELERNQQPATLKLFAKDKLLPYSSLFLINRKNILQAAKLFLPFWYSIPILSAIIGFFKQLTKKKPKSRHSDEIDDTEDILGEKTHTGDIRTAAQELEFAMLPAGHTIDSYLEELEERWSRLIDRKARENLINDVQYLVRDNLRRILRVEKHFKPTQEIIRQIADDMIGRNTALRSISARESLLHYIELYIVKLLGNLRELKMP